VTSEDVLSDWKYYSPSHSFPSAGDLLRAIPTQRNLRLERVVTDGREESIEAVRAAETLFGLEVTLRLLNEPDGALTLTIRDADHRDRAEFRTLGLDQPTPDDVNVYAEVSLQETAVDSAHAALADDALSGLEEVFGDGVAWCPATDEVVHAAGIVALMRSEEKPWTHVDLNLNFDRSRLEYVSERLASELPSATLPLLQRSSNQLTMRSRLPIALGVDEHQAFWSALREYAPYAGGGHIRFRERGQWSELVEGIGQAVAEVPGEWAASRRGLRGVITRLFRRD
jgi:hypothetical protein